MSPTEKEHPSAFDAWFAKNANVFESELLAEKHFLTDPENTVSIGCGTGLFEERHGIPRGVEPAEGMAGLARRRGIDVKIGSAVVHYYGAYSNAHRGVARRRKSFVDVPPEDEPFDSPRPDSPRLAVRRKSWARLIRRVYEVDPFLCRCGERMRVVGFITQPPIILKILHHIGRRFDPLKLPGRSPPLLDDFRPDPREKGNAYLIQRNSRPSVNSTKNRFNGRMRRGPSLSSSAPV